jgi:hypothetical protein
MSFAINLGCTVLDVFPRLPMNTTSGPLSPMKLSYRVKLPLSARPKPDGTTGLWIPRGALIEWLSRPSDGLGLASVRWLQEDYLVSSAELNQNCERVQDWEA